MFPLDSTSVPSHSMALPRNVLGGVLKSCSHDPLTGWVRDGCCNTDEWDHGAHVICIQATDEFLQFRRGVGNDLSTPIMEAGFPGLVEGDQWCLCASRWQDALEAGFAPLVDLEATHERALEYVKLDDLLSHAILKDIQ